MQTFLPHESFIESAKILDYRRRGKQRVEAMQILKALETGKGWVSHPITKMWTGYEDALRLYMGVMITEWVTRGYNNTMEIPQVTRGVEFPPWFGNKKFHSSHRANLLRKDPEYYSKFGWSENPDDFYCWLDQDNKWYLQERGKKDRIYL